MDHRCTWMNNSQILYSRFASLQERPFRIKIANWNVMCSIIYVCIKKNSNEYCEILCCYAHFSVFA